MPKIIQARTCYEAWRKGAEHLLAMAGGEALDLVLVVENASEWDEAWFVRIDPREVSTKGKAPEDVANTIFPLKTWLNSADRASFYGRYEKAHRRGKRKKWGTYFLRLISFGATKTNQLERAIDAINNWGVTPSNSICLHLSSPETDTIRLRGGPCLQAIQLHIVARRLELSVFYRNHDYFNKALPNLVGLARLQSFIASECGLEPGSLVCYSTHAYTNSTKATLRLLLAR